MERKTGLEPATPTLARWCSTTELLPHASDNSVSPLPRLCQVIYLLSSAAQNKPHVREYHTGNRMSIPLPEVMLPISPGYAVLRLFQAVGKFCMGTPEFYSTLILLLKRVGFSTK